MQKNKKTILFAFIFLGLSVAVLFSYPYIRFEFRKRLEKTCFVETRYPRQLFPTWNQTENMEVYFAPHGGEECICPEFPAIGVRSLSTGRWIQVVEVNMNPPEFNGDEVGWRLGQQDYPWFFADTSPDHRKAEIPFYGWGDRDQIFWDHPCWNIGPKFLQWFEAKNRQPRQWKARLYRVKVEDHVIEAVAGLSWGWREDDERNILEIKPGSLSPEDWEQDISRLRSSYSKWKFQTFRPK